MYATLSKKIVATDIKKRPNCKRTPNLDTLLFAFLLDSTAYVFQSFDRFTWFESLFFFLVENFFPSPGFEPWIGRMKIAFDHSPDKPS